MNLDRFPYRLYLVLSEEDCVGRDMLSVAEMAIKGGVDIIQLREKKCSTNEFLLKANRLSELLVKYNLPFIVNDHIDVAIASNASGIHVGNNDMPPSKIRSIWPRDYLIGYSIEYIEQLTNAEIAYSDYLGISPVFRTQTKLNTITEWGLEGISEIRSQTNMPLVAIGNMNEGNAFNVIKAGANCIAVVSAICAAKDPAKAAYAIRNQIEKAL